jgi:xanthine dehydrogenase accessory factor
VSACCFAELARFARAALEERRRAVLAHLVRVEGSHYRRAGARAVLAEDGGSAGAISAGCLEADLALRIPEVYRRKAAELVEYDLTADDDGAWGLGMGCGGRLTIRLSPVDDRVARELERIAGTLSAGRAARVETQLPDGDTCVEEIEPPVSLLVCGAGPDAAVLARQALLLGWNVHAASVKSGEAAERRFRDLGIALAAPAGIAQLAQRRRTAAVVMTHSFVDDLEMLTRLAGAPLAYLGVLGPRERTRRLVGALRSDGIILDAIHAPAGLDIGAETPEEIALAIAAEIHARLAGRPGGFLRDRAGAIHAPDPETAAVTAGCR